MPDPVLHLLVGPNGSGKSSLFELVIEPTTHLQFVNADRIAAEKWPTDTAAAAYDAAKIAAKRRSQLINDEASFATETVFSHESKLELVREAIEAGYLVTLHVLLVPVEIAVARVENRVENGGHPVPEEKVRERYERLWPLVGAAIALVTKAIVYDNSLASAPFRVVATSEGGQFLTSSPNWPSWTPQELRAAGT